MTSAVLQEGLAISVPTRVFSIYYYVWAIYCDNMHAIAISHCAAPRTCTATIAIWHGSITRQTSAVVGYSSSRLVYSS